MVEKFVQTRCACRNLNHSRSTRRQMDSLPVELISRIFINTLPPELDDPRYRIDELTPTQAAISCVCHQWDHIAKSTPEMWTFIVLSNRTKSHDSMRKRLELSGALPLNVSIRLSREETDNEYWGNPEVWENESFYEMHTLLLEKLARWKTLRVEATVNVPSELRQRIPFELPNVVGLSLHVVVLGYVPPDDMDSRGPFISAPRLTFCSSYSPVGGSESALLTNCYVDYFSVGDLPLNVLSTLGGIPHIWYRLPRIRNSFESFLMEGTRCNFVKTMSANRGSSSRDRLR